MSNPLTIFNSFTPQNPPPPDYTVPSFPSLYWPFPLRDGYSVDAYYLYYTYDVWRFTVLWTLILFGALHVITSTYAAFMLRRSWKLVLVLVPLLYVVVAGIQAFLAASLTGGLLGVLYNSGLARMSTWIPFVWGLTISLVLVLGAFAIEGGSF